MSQPPISHAPTHATRPNASRLPADASRSLWIYNLLFPFVFLALLPGLLARMMRRGNYREKFGQRFGRYSAQVRSHFSEGDWVWVHSISVGETLLALKLVQEIHALTPRRAHRSFGDDLHGFRCRHRRRLRIGWKSSTTLWTRRGSFGARSEW